MGIGGVAGELHAGDRLGIGAVGGVAVGAAHGFDQVLPSSKRVGGGGGRHGGGVVGRRGQS